MAVSSNSYFGNGKVQGTPTVAFDFDKFEEHATPRYAIGYKIEDSDGAVYRYSHFGATVSRGVVCSQDVSESSAGDSDNIIVASASAVNTTDGLIKSKYVQITSGGVLVNQFAGGKFITTDDTGEGYTYDIVGNTASGNPTTSNFRLELKQPLQVAVTSDTDFIIVGNKYANLEIATNGTDNILAGVACRSISVAGYYGWVQTKGICGALCEGTDVAGEKVTLSKVTSGAVASATSAGTGGGDTDQTYDQIIGTCVIAGDDSGHGAYDLCLE